MFTVSLAWRILPSTEWTSTYICAIAKAWKQPKCPSTEEWIKKMWYMYTMDYYSAIKKNKTLSYAATWMDLETITLSEVSQRKTNM